MPGGWGIQDPDNTNCQTACRNNPTEACGVSNTTTCRISLYEMPVSGSRYNASVLKLKQLFAFFLWPGPNRCDRIRTARSEGCEGEGIHGVCCVDRYCGRGYHCGGKKGLEVVLTRGWDWLPCCSVVKAEVECGSQAVIHS
jgi:hypothetical protein